MKLLKFSTQFCSQCRVVARNLKEANLPIEIEEIDAEENEQLSRAYNIQSVPVCIVIDDNHQIVKRWNGIFNMKELDEIVERNKIHEEFK